jgi:Tol biopolymer transport system component/DNA-binding winged helix-turn-helix (wHTH) protein
LEKTDATDIGTAPRSFSFDDFVVDPANRILLRGGVEIPLTAKVFDVLLTFVRNPGRLLSKEELIESVWGSEFVEEGNLARNVSTLRKALCETGAEHKIIITVHGRGYRFIRNVTEDNAHSVTSRISHSAVSDGNDLKMSPRNEGPAMWRRLAMIASAGLVVLILTFIALQFGLWKTRADDALTIDRVTQTRLTQGGNVYGGTISPDAKYIAYTTIAGGDQALCVMQISTGTVTRLVPTGVERRVWGTAFSPDVAFLYFIMKEKSASNADLYRIPVLGGDAKKVAVHADGGPSISPDGHRVAFTRLDRDAGTISLVVTNNGQANEAVIDTLELPAIYNTIEWAPDGQTFLYGVKQQEDKRDVWSIGEMSANGGTKRQIGPTSYSRIITARWVGNKSGIVINALDKDSRQPQIYFVSYPDGEKRRVTNDLNTYFGISTSADGKSLVTNTTTISRHIWIAATDDKSKPVQITSGSDRRFGNITWVGPDEIAFEDDEKGSYDNFNVLIMSSDGSGVRQLTASGSYSYQPHSMLDGSKTVFVSKRSGKREIWKMNGDGSDQQQLTDIVYDASQPRISSDGRTVYFLADVGGTAQIWRVPFAGGVCERVIDVDVHGWDLSPDGRQIAFSYFDAAQGKLTSRIHLIEGLAVDKFLDIVPETAMRWSHNGKSIYYTTAQDEVRNIWRIDIAGGKPKPVTSFEDQRIFDFSLSSDSKKLACVRENIAYDAVMLRSE